MHVIKNNKNRSIDCSYRNLKEKASSNVYRYIMQQHFASSNKHEMLQQLGLKDKDRREAFDYATIIISFTGQMQNRDICHSNSVCELAAPQQWTLVSCFTSLFREDLKYLQASDICISENPSFT